MTHRLLNMFLYDVLFQFRHGFYLIYLIISAIYIAVLFNIPTAQRLVVTNILVFSDTSVLGLTFVGAILLLEKQQHILHSLFVTPLRLFEYLLAKMLSLSLIALMGSLLILLIPNGLKTPSALFVLGVMSGSIIFTLIGLGVGARVNSLNGYIFGIMMGTMIFCLPLLGYLHIHDGWWLNLLPTHAILLLLASIHQPLSAAQIIYALCCLLVWTTATWLFAVMNYRILLRGA
jgi:fluoroquinolone transport system permease protein